MRIIQVSLISTILILSTGAALAQRDDRGERGDRGGGFSFRFDRDDRRGDVEGKRANLRGLRSHCASSSRREQAFPLRLQRPGVGR